MPITYYDFSLAHPDFAGTSLKEFSRPNLVASAYGAWPRISDNPTADVFSLYFRQTSDDTNRKYDGNLTLKYQNTTFKHLFATDAFFPLDATGFDNQGQVDCDGAFHNFGFTTAIRSGFTFLGNGTLTIGGGDEVWVYINRVLALEVVTDPAAATLPCKFIDLSPAAGDGKIIPKTGNIVGSECQSQVATPSEQFQVNLDIGETYHIDIFLIERKPCRSRLLLETESIRWAVRPGDPLPVDYIVKFSEDSHVGAIGLDFTLVDPFSVGPSYTIELTNGNEARHFTFKSDTSAARTAGIPPPLSNFTYTNLPGLNTPFIGKITIYVSYSLLISFMLYFL